MRKFTIRKFAITIRICKNIGEWKDGKKDAFLIPHSLQISRVFCKWLMAGIYSLIIAENPRESAKKRSLLDDLLNI